MLTKEIKLNKEQIGDLGWWIDKRKLIRPEICPFTHCGVKSDLKTCEHTCMALFPKSRDSVHFSSDGTTYWACPCELYNHKYVVRRAKEVLKWQK